MARPHKKGIEYFSFDVDMREDPDVRRLILSFGSEYARLIYIDLLSYIYRHEGIFMGASVDDLSIFADTFRHTLEDVKKVVEAGIKIGLFDAAYYKELEILTSNSIVKRYELATKRRSEKNTVYLPELPSSVVIENNNEVNVCNNSISADRNTTKESKVKESKVKNSLSLSLSQVETEPDQTSLKEEREDLFEKPLDDHQLRLLYDHYGEEPITRARSELRNWMLAKGETRASELHTLLYSLKKNAIEPLKPDEACDHPDCERGLIFDEGAQVMRPCPHCESRKRIWEMQHKAWQGIIDNSNKAGVQA